MSFFKSTDLLNNLSIQKKKSTDTKIIPIHRISINIRQKIYRCRKILPIPIQFIFLPIPKKSTYTEELYRYTKNLPIPKKSTNLPNRYRYLVEKIPIYRYRLGTFLYRYRSTDRSVDFQSVVPALLIFTYDIREESAV